MNKNSTITDPAGTALEFGTLPAYRYLASIGVTEFYANGRPKKFTAVETPDPAPYIPGQRVGEHDAETLAALEFTPLPD